MAVHMVTRVGGEDYRITLSRDDAGNYVAEAARLLRAGDGAGTFAPHLRVVDAVKERALAALFGSLQQVADERRDASPSGPDLPAA
jgi:hypothetical protein